MNINDPPPIPEVPEISPIPAVQAALGTWKVSSTLLVVALSCLALLTTASCNTGNNEKSRNDNTQKLVIFHAASLARPFEKLSQIFESENPSVKVVREASGSHIAIRKITELGRKADIMASADEALIKDLLYPEHVDWSLVFATDRIVLAYGDQSKYRDEINKDNWYKILLREDVNYGYSDPATAPAGAYTLLAWQLADSYYSADTETTKNGLPISRQLFDKCSPRFIRPHCTELLPMLQAKTVDYIFEFRAVAMQHHLQWLKLPDQLDMGSIELADHYANASIEIGNRGNTAAAGTGKAQSMRGRPILYGLSIPKNADNPDAAEKFISLLLSDRGREIFVANHLEAPHSATCFQCEKLPQSLRPHVKEL